MIREIVICVSKLGTKHDDVCRGCVLGKYANRIDNRPDGMLGLIHLDISGPCVH